MRRRQGVKHREDGRRSDARAEEHDGSLVGPQSEVSAWGADLENTAHPHMVSQVGARHTVWLDLHADPIAIHRDGSGKRVAAKKRRATDAWKAQSHVLAWQRFRQRLAVSALHRQRHNISRFLVNRRHPQRPESRRGRVRSRCRRQPRVAVRPTSEQGGERRPPARRERGDLQRAFQSVARMRRRIEQSVDLGDRHLLLALIDLHDLVAGANLAFLEDAEVESGPPAGGQERRHARLVHANADAIAGDPGLRDLKQSAANPIAIANIDAVIRQAFDCEVLAELSVDKVGPSELFLPVAIGLELVDENRAVLSSMPGEIALTVSLKVQFADATPSCTGSFQTPVCTVLPLHTMSRGRPTLTDNNRAISSAQINPCRFTSSASRLAAHAPKSECRPSTARSGSRLGCFSNTTRTAQPS